MKLSIVICTYNREDVLEYAIKSLLNQTYQEKDYEVLIIDNNSNDSTPEISKRYTDKYKNIKYFFEVNQGLSHARNKGFKEAEGEYVAYIDDDAQAEENWVKEAINIIESFSPDIFGGPIYPYYLSEKPEWFKDEWETRIHINKTGWYPEKHGAFSGSNVVFKKELLLKYQGFDTELGMKGNKIAFGEETDLIHKAREDNKRLYYSLDLKVRHLVPQLKMNRLFYIGSSVIDAKYFLKRMNKKNNKKLKTISINEKYELLYSSNYNLINSIECYLNNKKNDINCEEDVDLKNIKKSIFKVAENIFKLDQNSNNKKSFWDKLLDFNLRKLLKK